LHLRSDRRRDALHHRRRHRLTIFGIVTLQGHTMSDKPLVDDLANVLACNGRR
jgi:hypothetical protein